MGGWLSNLLTPKPLKSIEDTLNTGKPFGGRKVAKSMKPGGGGRFAAFKKHVEAEGYSPESAGAIAASAGRKKYGKAKMAHFSSQGRKRSKLSHAIRKRHE